MINIIDLKRVADLGPEPVTLQEAKTQLRVTFADDDTEITALITKARKSIENYCNRSIVYQRILLVADMCESWELPWGPVIGLEAVQNNSSQSGSGPVTYADTTSGWKVDGSLFQPVEGRRYRLTYTAGDYCPEDLKQAILTQITFLYENRGESSVSPSAKDLAAPYFIALWM